MHWNIVTFLTLDLTYLLITTDAAIPRAIIAMAMTMIRVKLPPSTRTERLLLILRSAVVRMIQTPDTTVNSGMTMLASPTRIVRMENTRIMTSPVLESPKDSRDLPSMTFIAASAIMVITNAAMDRPIPM